jgi:hypothetical protein
VAGASAAERAVCPGTAFENAINARAIAIEKTITRARVRRSDMGSPFLWNGRQNLECFAPGPTNGTVKSNQAKSQNALADKEEMLFSKIQSVLKSFS